jgi:hypothetical protein
MASAASISSNLGAQRQGHDWRCPCPRECGYALSLADGEDGALLAHCFGGCEFNDIIASLVEYGLLDSDGEVDVSPSITLRVPEDPARFEAARWMYDRLIPAAGTIVETYLRSRAITLPVPTVLRFGAAPHRLGGLFPAMAAPVVNVDGNQTGIHCSYLRADGDGKADFNSSELQRECRGVIRGGSIRLAPHDPNRELIIGEGVETVLSAMELFGLPGWSAVSAGGLKTIDLPAAVRGVLISADNDERGCSQRNAVEVAPLER